MKFSDIIGQDKIKNYLIHTVKSNRVSHAQLFIGPEGCGKLQLAIAYAQFISCMDKKYDDSGKGPGGDSCGVCRSCVKFEKLAHPDLHFFYPVTTSDEVKKNPKSADYLAKWRQLIADKNGYISLTDWYEAIGVSNKQGIINADDCNEIIKTLGYKSYESEYKTIIIWMADKLYHAAAPKILKILEEPPDKTLFILITESQDQILSTIVSRTQLLKIPKLTDLNIVQALSASHGVPEIRARKIAVLASGNYRTAVDMITTEEEDSDHFIRLREWFRMCYRASAADMIDLVSFSDEASRIGREKQKSFFSYALRVVRNCMLFGVGNNHLVKLEGDEAEFVRKLSGFIHPGNAGEMAAEFEKAIYHVERNANPKLLFMDLSMILCRLIRQKAA